MIGGLPWGTWLLLLASPAAGLAIVVSAYRRFRRGRRFGKDGRRA